MVTPARSVPWYLHILLHRVYWRGCKTLSTVLYSGSVQFTHNATVYIYVYVYKIPWHFVYIYIYIYIYMTFAFHNLYSGKSNIHCSSQWNQMVDQTSFSDLGLMIVLEEKLWMKNPCLDICQCVMRLQTLVESPILTDNRGKDIKWKVSVYFLYERQRVKNKEKNKSW